MGAVTLSTLDHSSEETRTKYRGVDLTAGNIAAQTALIDALRASQIAVTVGYLQKQTVLASETLFAGVLPPAAAQRELKWLVRMTDTVLGNPLSVQIGTPDLSLLSPNSDQMDLTGAAAIALIADIEAYHLSPALNPVVVRDILLVGRNL